MISPGLLEELRSFIERLDDAPIGSILIKTRHGWQLKTPQEIKNTLLGFDNE